MVWDLSTMRFLNETHGESEDVKTALINIDAEALNACMKQDFCVAQSAAGFVVSNEAGEELSSHDTLFEAFQDIKKRSKVG